MKTTFAQVSLGQEFSYNGYRWIKRSRGTATAPGLKGVYSFAESDFVALV